MQLIKKMFGRGPAPGLGAESAQFHESEDSTATGSRNAPRRELVQVVLRDSMRRHGIPSAWIDCRILSVVTRRQKTGMHVQLIVRDGVDRLLTYVPAFQTSFMNEIARFDPRVDEWLLSLSWQFHNPNAEVPSTMPAPDTWSASAAAAPGDALAAVNGAALGAKPATAASAARQGLAPEPPELPAIDMPAAAVAPAAAPAAQPEPDPTTDQEVLEDLQALYAIRDAALRPQQPQATGPAGERDFESTHPGAGAGPDAGAPGPLRR
jgi:hypothetical protein